MQEAAPRFLFRSELFQIDPKEDAETNPFCYGRELACWIRARFAKLDYAVEDIIPEDWGWCVVLQRVPFMLWIGCGCVHSHLYGEITPEQKEFYKPRGADFTWICIVGTDAPIWPPFFWKKIVGKANEAQSVCRAALQLEDILRSEAGISLVEVSQRE